MQKIAGEGSDIDTAHYRTVDRDVSCSTAAARAKGMPTVARLLNHRPPVATIRSSLLHSSR